MQGCLLKSGWDRKLNILLPRVFFLVNERKHVYVHVFGSGLMSLEQQAIYQQVEGISLLISPSGLLENLLFSVRPSQIKGNVDQ